MRNTIFLCELFLTITLNLQEPAPVLDWPTNWGHIKQDGRRIEISGHVNWIASGQVRDDGSIQLQWVHLFDGKSALSIYQRKGNDLHGTWGWATECEYADDGTLKGDVRDDVTFKLPE